MKTESSTPWSLSAAIVFGWVATHVAKMNLNGTSHQFALPLSLLSPDFPVACLYCIMRQYARPGVPSELGDSLVDWSSSFRLIESFQSGETSTFIEHSTVGVARLAANDKAILVFSGYAIASTRHLINPLRLTIQLKVVQRSNPKLSSQKQNHT